MQKEWLEPFLQALVSTFSNLGVVWKRDSLTFVSPTVTLSALTVDVGIVGEVSGKFQFTCTKETGLFLANKFRVSNYMEPVDTFGDLERSAFSEIANWLGASAATAFSKGVLDTKTGAVISAPLKINISPPSVTEGEQVVSHLFTKYVVAIKLDLEGHKGELFIALV